MIPSFSLKEQITLLKSILKEEKNRLENLENTNLLLDPENILKRGYTLTFSHGMLIKNVLQLKPGDQIMSKWKDGTAISSVDEIQNSNSKE